MNSLSDAVIPGSEARQALRLWRLLPAGGGKVSTADPTVDHRVFQLDAHFESGGTWAGVNQLIEAAWLSLLDNAQNALLAKHDHELYMVLPRYRDRISPTRLCLTDTVAAAERTRFYSLERAWRMVHGLVGLVLDWKRVVHDKRRWIIVVRNFDQAQHLATRFFTALARRATRDHAIEVIVEARHVPSNLVQGVPWTVTVALDALPPPSMADVDPEVTAAIDGNSDDVMEEHYPALLRQYQRRGDDLAAARLALKVLRLCNRRGYYHEAVSFIDAILPAFDRLAGNDEASRMNAVSEMNSCLVATGDGERARRIVEDLAQTRITRPHLMANLHYILAMHELRYLETRSVESADRHILTAMENVHAAMAETEAARHAFLKAFIENGLAFLRVRQHRFQEALDLCGVAYEDVTRELGDDRHRLHRSVLQYNMAQIHVVLEQFEQALACYRMAIHLDPFYTEYHLESANILLRLGRHAEAIDCCEQAIFCGPPYPEVYFTKSVCHTHLEQWTEALACSGFSLELDPDQPELHIVRADIFSLLEQADAAMAEYDKAVALVPDSIPMRVNRAVLYFNAGSFERALADMNDVIAQEPQESAHYENRAAIYEAIDQRDLHARDLDMARRCKEFA